MDCERKLTEVNGAQRRAREAGTGLTCIKFSTFLRFALGLFLGLGQRHGLLECLAHFVQALVIEIVNTSGALGAKVYQIVILAHGQTQEADCDPAIMKAVVLSDQSQAERQTSISTNSPWREGESISGATGTVLSALVSSPGSAR